jgi:hypothetical protein
MTTTSFLKTIVEPPPESSYISTIPQIMGITSIHKSDDTNEGGWRRDRGTYASRVCFTLIVTEYFVHQLSENDWLARECDSKSAEASKLSRHRLLSATLKACYYIESNHCNKWLHNYSAASHNSKWPNVAVQWSRGPGFKSGPGDRLSWLFFRVFSHSF